MSTAKSARRKDSRIRYTFVPTQRSIFLLEFLGYVDKRDHSLRKEKNLNEFLNSLIEDFFDEGGKKLEIAWLDWQLKVAAQNHAEAFREIDRLQKLKHSLEEQYQKDLHASQKANVEVVLR